jgi:hypothetical protein
LGGGTNFCQKRRLSAEQLSLFVTFENHEKCVNRGNDGEENRHDMLTEHGQKKNVEHSIDDVISVLLCR